MTLDVRCATRGDLLAVLAVERAAFGGEAEATLVAQLVESAAFVPELSLVAEYEAAGRRRAIVGHVLFSRARAGTENAALLAPLAVLPGWQGRGVGSALVRAGLERAAELGFGIALVLGHPDYYPRFGFVPAKPLGVLPPYPVSLIEAWMTAELAPGALERSPGVVEVAEPLRHAELWREE